MSLGDIIILAALFLWLLLSLRYMRKRRKTENVSAAAETAAPVTAAAIRHLACRSRQAEEVKQQQKQRTERKETQKIE